MYFIASGQAAAGKTDSLFQANQIFGTLLFPTGQGMAGVNVVARRWEQYTAASQADGWYSVSSVSGSIFKREQGNPVTGTDDSEMGSMGTSSSNNEGFYEFTRIPMLPGNWQNVIIDTEPVNPLYTGQYSVGPYIDNTVDPSGSDAPGLASLLGSYFVDGGVAMNTNGAASGCDTERRWSRGGSGGYCCGRAGGRGLLCSDGHAAWSTLAVKGGRSFTIEVTAEDEEGFASSAKGNAGDWPVERDGCAGFAAGNRRRGSGVLTGKRRA